MASKINEERAMGIKKPIRSVSTNSQIVFNMDNKIEKEKEKAAAHFGTDGKKKYYNLHSDIHNNQPARKT